MREHGMHLILSVLGKTEALQAPLGIAEQYKEVEDEATAVGLRARMEGATPQAIR